MSDESERELKPEAEGPEQDITSEAPEITRQEAASANRPESEESSEDAPEDEDDESGGVPQPEPKLERLQKILAQAGIASRRHAEEMITEGRVQVNGQVVNTLGAKADAGRDHIRVDGKLLHGAERQRYFMLNKPKGYVTTVSDPEGRSTIMEFFAKMPERLYPVGRLDYQSEGLLLVTNDGALANGLTKASAGVEKTYLVKVAGQPTEEELEVLRGGVTIDRGKPGEGRVRTAAARVRQVRQGDNPWYEVVLIEGRNRELRKMFEEIGHFVEKIRRVGYGPLVLDLEPGKLRELDAEEVAALRLAAEGKLKPRKPKVKDTRLRKAMDAQLPTLAPKPSRRPYVKPPQAADAPAAERTFRPRDTSAGKFGSSAARPRKSFGPNVRSGPDARSGGDTRSGAEKSFRPATGRPTAGRPAAGPARFGSGRPSTRPPFNPERSAARPAWKKDDRPSRPPARPAWKEDDRAGAGRSFGAKPAWKKPSGDRPAFKRPAPPREAPPAAAEEFVKRPPTKLRIEAIEADSPRTARTGPPRARPAFDRPKPAFDRPRTDRPKFEKSGSDRPKFDRPKFDRPKSDRPQFDRPKLDRPKPDGPRFDRPRSEQAGRGFSSGSTRPSGPGRSGAGPGASRPARTGGLARPFTTSTGKPRPGGARPSNKHGKPAGKSFGKGPGSGPAGGSGARPAGKTGWKPKTGSTGKPAFGGRSKPKTGGFSKPSGFKGKPGGTGRSGPRPGGKKPGGKRG